MRQEHSVEDARVISSRTVRVALGSGLLMVGACVSSHRDPLQRYEFSQAQMGLEFRLTLYTPDAAAAQAAATAAYARIAELNQILSDYDPDSELSQLSRSSGSGEGRAVSPELWRVLEAGQKLSLQSGGAFDLTIGPSVNLWRRARRQQALPALELLSEMRARVGYTNLLLEAHNRRAQLTRPNMRLDAGGIAKGYALDEAMAVLRERGVERAMIHAGGDLIVGAPPPGRKGWTVELPAGGAPHGSVLLLANQALATSGDLSQFVEFDGVRYSHIIDPRTGLGLTNRTLVHVIAPAGITADSLATAFSVMGTNGLSSVLPLYPRTEAQMTEGMGSAARTARSAGFDRFLVRP